MSFQNTDASVEEESDEPDDEPDASESEESDIPNSVDPDAWNPTSDSESEDFMTDDGEEAEAEHSSHTIQWKQTKAWQQEAEVDEFVRACGEAVWTDPARRDDVPSLHTGPEHRVYARWVQPGKNNSMDEAGISSRSPWLRTYNPGKPNKYFIEILIACDSVTRFCWAFFVTESAKKTIKNRHRRGRQRAKYIKVPHYQHEDRWFILPVYYVRISTVPP